MLASGGAGIFATQGGVMHRIVASSTSTVPFATPG
jgi:hypothetical protein